MSSRSVAKDSPVEPGFFVAAPAQAHGVVVWVALCALLAACSAALSALAVHAPGDAQRWAFSTGGWTTQPWSLITGPLAHVDTAHLAGNLLALAALCALGLIWRVPAAMALCGLMAWPVGTAGLLAWDAPLSLMGLSGVLHALACILAVHAGASALAHRRVLGLLLFIGVIIKLASEQAWRQPLVQEAGGAGMPVLVAAHLSGAVAGLVLALLLCAASLAKRPRSTASDPAHQ